jgi:hypothetical protein
MDRMRGPKTGQRQWKYQTKWSIFDHPVHLAANECRYKQLIYRARREWHAMCLELGVSTELRIRAASRQGPGR